MFFYHSTDTSPADPVSESRDAQSMSGAWDGALGLTTGRRGPADITLAPWTTHSSWLTSNPQEAATGSYSTTQLLKVAGDTPPNVIPGFITMFCWLIWLPRLIRELTSHSITSGCPSFITSITHSFSKQILESPEKRMSKAPDGGFGGKL